MRMHVLTATVLAMLCASAGCQTAKKVADPKTITLEAALVSVGEGLSKMYDAKDPKYQFGMLPSEVTVAFNVKATGEDGGKLYVEASAKPVETVTIGKIGGEIMSKQTGERGNTITIKMTNVLFAPKDTLLTMKSPEEIAQLLQTIRKDGISVFFVPQ